MIVNNIIAKPLSYIANLNVVFRAILLIVSRKKYY
jgi:hypothetical protein